MKRAGGGFDAAYNAQLQGKEQLNFDAEKSKPSAARTPTGTPHPRGFTPA
jgi:hypothetical protein